MPTDIDRNTLGRLVAEGAQLVEVLPPSEYDEEHLPGAVSLPLRRLNGDSAAALKRDAPVVTYCWDGT